MGFCRFYIEGDNFYVIRVFRGEISKLWIIDNIMKNTGLFLIKWGTVCISYIYREVNRAVNWIVNY